MVTKPVKQGDKGQADAAEVGASLAPHPQLAAEARKAIYEQDGHFLRYRDGLKWSRFQTVSAIEGAGLYGAFQMSTLSTLEHLGVMIVATLLIFLIFVLVFVDEKDVASHLERVKNFEIDAGYPYPPTKRRPLLGVKTTRYVMGVLLLFNLFVIGRLAAGVACSQ